METFSSRKKPSQYNKQNQYQSSINSTTKTKMKLLSNYHNKHYQTSLSLQQFIPQAHKSKKEDRHTQDIRIKLLKDYLLSNNEIDRRIMLMILQPSQSYQEQSYQKFLLRQLSHKVKSLIDQNKRLHKQSQEQDKTSQILLYIKTINQNNKDKMNQQQQMINNLQLKLNALEQVRQYLKQLQFEKIVKIQQSSTKNKISIIQCPPPLGQNSFVNQIGNLNVQKSVQFLNLLDDQTEKQGILQNEFRELCKKNEQLREQLQILRQILDNERQNKIKELGQKQQLQTNLQKLKQERKQYQFNLNQANEQLRELSAKLQQYQTYQIQYNKPKSAKIEHLSIPVISQLIDIKNMLIKCNKNNIHCLQAQLIQLIQERNQYRHQYLKLKNKIYYNESKSQMKYLTDKNLQLQQKCCFYEKQIDKYEAKLREMMEERQKGAIDNMIKDFQDMNNSYKDDLGIKYSRATHTCIINTINRLEQLQKSIVKPQTN